MTILNALILLLFAPTVALICLGIWHEEKLIAFEQRLFRKVVKRNANKSL